MIVMILYLLAGRVSLISVMHLKAPDKFKSGGPLPKLTNQVNPNILANLVEKGPSQCIKV